MLYEKELLNLVPLYGVPRFFALAEERKKQMALQNKILDGGEKITIFDSNAYITIATKGIDIGGILRKEKGEDIKAYAHFWILAELLQCGDIKTLEIVNKHCSENSGLLRFFADPVSQVYRALYREDLPDKERLKQQNIADLFDKSLGGNLSEQERKAIKSELENAASNFVTTFLNYNGSDDLNSNKIREYAIYQVILLAKNLRGDTTSISCSDFNAIEREFPAAGIVYQDLMKRKLQQNKNNINITNLLHDQRDWQLFFYGGKDNIYIVTQENRIKALNLKNIISLEDYFQKILHM